MKKIIILILTVALSFYPSVTSLAADETTEIQESLPIPNPGPPMPVPDPPTLSEEPTPPEPTPPEEPCSELASWWDNDNASGGMNDGLESGPQMPDLGDSQSDKVEDSQYQPDFSEYLETLKILDSRFQKIINNQETIRRNQLDTLEVIRTLTQAIRTLTRVMGLTNLWLVIRLILVPLFESFQRKQDNANQEETRLNNPEPSFDPDMMDK